MIHLHRELAFMLVPVFINCSSRSFFRLDRYFEANESHQSFSTQAKLGRTRYCINRGRNPAIACRCSVSVAVSKSALKGCRHIAPGKPRSAEGRNPGYKERETQERGGSEARSLIQNSLSPRSCSFSFLYRGWHRTSRIRLFGASRNSLRSVVGDL